MLILTYQQENISFSVRTKNTVHYHVHLLVIFSTKKQKQKKKGEGGHLCDLTCGCSRAKKGCGSYRHRLLKTSERKCMYTCMKKQSTNTVTSCLVQQGSTWAEKEAKKSTTQ